MIEPVFRTGKGGKTVRPSTDYDRLMRQVDEGVVRIGREAAREIAQRIEEQGGFWDHPHWVGQV